MDGGSSDATAQIAAKNGARVIRSPIARRSSQMNMGARAAVGDAVLFLHADTSLPENAVSSVRTALSDTSAVLGAFPASFAVGGKRMPAAELQSAWKTHYLPALLRPRSYARGLRVVLGDQAMFARKKDLLQQDVGGFDEVRTGQIAHHPPQEAPVITSLRLDDSPPLIVSPLLPLPSSRRLASLDSIFPVRGVPSWSHGEKGSLTAAFSCLCSDLPSWRTWTFACACTALGLRGAMRGREDALCWPKAV